MDRIRDIENYTVKKDIYRILYSAVTDKGDIIMDGECNASIPCNRIDEIGLIAVLDELSDKIANENHFVNFSISRITFCEQKIEKILGPPV